MEYYQQHGYFEARVMPLTDAGKEPGNIDLAFAIHKGSRYHVRNAIIEGNTKLETAVLKAGLKLHSGRPYLQSVRDADKNRMLMKYSEIGYIDAHVAVEPKVTNESGVIDLVYKIQEGAPHLLGELKIEGSARTRNRVIDRGPDSTAPGRSSPGNRDASEGP